MRVLSQLLREFWLPLLLGLLWTVYNLADKPWPQWTLRETLNTLGPTFFFMSWLVAQWYRVRKQQRVEDELGTIQSGVRAIQEPLFPCGLFLTLVFRATEEDLQRLFGEQRGYRLYGPDKPMPPPPIGLPPGLSEGRLFSQEKYLDYKDGVVVGAGVVRTNHPAYNGIYRPVSHTVSHLSRSALETARHRNEPLLAVPAVKVELRLDTQRATPPAPVVLTGSMVEPEVVDAWALDQEVFVDLVIQQLAPTAPLPPGLSSSSLSNSLLRFTLDFFFIKGLSDIPRASWPTLHNLQLWVGGQGRQLLAFKSEHLAAQVTHENPKPLAHGQAICPQILFEIRVDPATFAQSFVTLS